MRVPLIDCADTTIGYDEQVKKNQAIGALRLGRDLAVHSMFDHRLGRRHRELLGCIVVLIGNGVEVAPCFDKLSKVLGLSYGSIRNVMADLRKWGYIVGDKKAAAFGDGRAVAHYTPSVNVCLSLSEVARALRVPLVDRPVNAAVDPETWSTEPTYKKRLTSPPLMTSAPHLSSSTGVTTDRLLSPNTVTTEMPMDGPHPRLLSSTGVTTALPAIIENAPAPAHIFGKEDAENGKDENSEPSKPASVAVPLINPPQKEAAGRPASACAGSDELAEAEFLFAPASLSEPLGVTLPAAFAAALASGTAKNSAATFRSRLATVLADGMPAEHVEAELEKAVLHADKRAGGNATVADLLASGLSFLKNIRPPRSERDRDEPRPTYSARSFGRDFGERMSCSASEYNDEPEETGYVPGDTVVRREFWSIAGGSPKKVNRCISDGELAEIAAVTGRTVEQAEQLAVELLEDWQARRFGGGHGWRDVFRQQAIERSRSLAPA